MNPCTITKNKYYYYYYYYIQHLTVQVSDIYNISESLSRHFLVEEAAREHLEKCLRHIKAKMGQLRHKLVEFGTKLDDILERVIKEGIHVGFWTTVKLAFQMNRITALIQTCEDRLKLVRTMLDDLDTHVAGKSFLAYLVTYLSFIGSISTLEFFCQEPVHKL